MTRRPALLLLALAAAASALAPATAHPDGMWPDPPTLTPAQAARVDRLAARAVAYFARRPAAERAGRGGWLGSALIGVGQCRRAERQIRANPPLPQYMSWIVIEAAGSRDRDCIDRMLALAAESPGWQVETSSDPDELYAAGALWRRLGRRPQGEAAIAAAERRLEQLDAADEYAWMCHGGYCLARLWEARLFGLRLYHGTELYSEELHRLAALAFEDRRADEAGRGPRRIGQRVFDELFWAAMNEEETALAQRLAAFTSSGRARLPAARMSLLIREGRVDEALELWPAAGPAFGAGFDRAFVRANVHALHRWRVRFREWQRYGQAAETLSLLPVMWIERGDRAHAAEALATARADIDAGGGEWRPSQRGRLAAVEALLEGGADPVAWLAARQAAADALDRDHGFAELAGGLAANGRLDQARLALDRIAESAIRHRTLVELPCRAASAGAAAAQSAVGLAQRTLGLIGSSRDDEAEFGSMSHSTLRCLVRAGLGEAALAYADAVRDPERKLALLSGMPSQSFAADAAGLRRRFATRAYGHVEAHDLWHLHHVAELAAAFERLGDFGQVDRILDRARTDEVRRRIFEKLLLSYAEVGN